MKPTFDHDIGKEDCFAFTEWVGEHYMRLHDVWVREDQLNPLNHRTTAQLYEIWKEDYHSNLPT